MRFLSSWVVLLFVVGSTLAANTIRFVNHCPHDLFFWPVGPLQQENDGAFNLVAGNGGSSTHTMTEGSTGTSIKIRDLPHYQVAPSGILQAEYNLEPHKGTVWYDFSAIDCLKGAGPEHPNYCPFLQGGVRMHVPGAHQGRCRVAKCMPGQACDGVYLDHGHWRNEPAWNCVAGSDIVFETCVAGTAPQSICPIPSHHHALALALAQLSSPPSSPAPVAESPSPYSTGNSTGNSTHAPTPSTLVTRYLFPEPTEGHTPAVEPNMSSPVCEIVGAC